MLLTKAEALNLFLSCGRKITRQGLYKLALAHNFMVKKGTAVFYNKIMIEKYLGVGLDLSGFVSYSQIQDYPDVSLSDFYAICKAYPADCKRVKGKIHVRQERLVGNCKSDKRGNNGKG